MRRLMITDFRQLKREIVCSIKNHKELCERYPKRTVIPYYMCPDDSFFFFSRFGHVREVKMKDWSVWVLDEDYNFPFSIKLKRIR